MLMSYFYTYVGLLPWVLKQRSYFGPGPRLGCNLAIPYQQID